jgi:hypothetical protein
LEQGPDGSFTAQYNLTWNNKPEEEAVTYKGSSLIFDQHSAAIFKGKSGLAQ